MQQVHKKDDLKVLNLASISTTVAYNSSSFGKGATCMRSKTDLFSVDDQPLSSPNYVVRSAQLQEKMPGNEPVRNGPSEIDESI